MFGVGVGGSYSIGDEGSARAEARGAVCESPKTRSSQFGQHWPKPLKPPPLAHTVDGRHRGLLPGWCHDTMQHGASVASVFRFCLAVTWHDTTLIVPFHAVPYNVASRHVEVDPPTLCIMEIVQPSTEHCPARMPSGRPSQVTPLC